MIARQTLLVALAWCAGRAVCAEELPPPVKLTLQFGESSKSEQPQGVDEKRSRSAIRFRLSFDLDVSWELPSSRREADASRPAKPDAADDGRLTEVEWELIDLTNKEREKLKLPPLKADPVLMKLAREQNAHMVRLNQLGHELEGETFSKRLKERGYRAMTAGENCAEGASSPKEAVADWMTSEGHKSNILSNKYTHLGVAQGKSKEGKTYSTQVFAKPFEDKIP